MQKHNDITLGRIQSFLKLRLEPQLLGDTHPLTVEHCPVDHFTEKEARDKGPWQVVEKGFTWGPEYAEVWFRITGQIPKAWAGKEVGMIADVGGERTVWIGNTPERGLDGKHDRYRLTDSAKGNEKIDLLIQAYVMGDVRVHGVVPPKPEKPGEVADVHLVQVESQLFPLYYDVLFCLNLAKAHPNTDPVHATLVRALNDVCNIFVDGEPLNWARCRKVLKDAVGSLPGEVKHSITAVGHAHLDTAWLWPLRTTHRKMAHTAANQLYNISRYPSYVFAHSQASQYEWVEQEYPALFKRIQKATDEGGWEPVGSMWVEADCNLTGPESYIRQFFYGLRYFKKHFGKPTEDMWLPDTFGYSAATPQILNKFGIKYFLTQKISWNQINKFPHNTFWWQGIDGSRIWSHFPPADTYIGDCTPEQLLNSVKQHKDHARSDMSLYLFGWGDGGGGPTEQHLELIDRARTCGNLPEVHTKKKAVEFFREAKAKSKDLVTWAGELYLEFHRGTYTTQARNKQGNRSSEFLMRDAELLACFTEKYPKTYPAAELERLWKLVLLNQFHDIIPGSSISQVYEDSDRDYAEIKEKATGLIEESLRAIGGRFDTTSCQKPYALFQNATIPTQGSIPWSGDAPGSLSCGDERLPVQLVDDQLIFQTPADSLGAVAIGDFTDLPSTTRTRLKVRERSIENGEFRVRFDQHGNITSIQTVEDKPIEFITPGKLGNLFQLFDDRPNFWDAWDVDPFIYESGQDLVKSESFEIVERGPVRVAVQITKRFGKSTIKQRISLGPTPGIRFDTWVDWHEDHKMLKVAFPVTVNSPRATYEIQFGHVERPTHGNTSWDMAKFEVCAQKWADLSEGGHGVAILNDCKYGHDIRGNMMRLSLLRSPKAPDPNCDMKEHHFSYVILPHYDSLIHSDIVAAAYAFNSPLRAVPLDRHEGARVESPRLVSVDTRHMVIEAVKKAEDNSDLIVRLYECHNSRGSAELYCARGISQAWLCDLNEEPLQELEVVDGAVMLDYKPFEIHTVRIRS